MEVIAYFILMVIGITIGMAVISLTYYFWTNQIIYSDPSNLYVTVPRGCEYFPGILDDKSYNNGKEVEPLYIRCNKN